MTRAASRHAITKALSLREQVERSLRAALFSGEMVTGQTYSVPGLAEKYGVSATPVREAVLELTNEGLLIAVPNKGFRVADISRETLIQLTEIRRLIEVPTTVELAKTITPEDVERLRELALLTRRYAERNDLVNYIEADRKFHHEMLVLSGNPLIAEYVEDMRSRVRLHALPAIIKVGMLVTGADLHLDVLDAIVRGDAEAIDDAVTRHMSLAVDTYGALQEGPAEDA
jgi:DNA-binding GntR family transcriptional regulator